MSDVGDSTATSKRRIADAKEKRTSRACLACRARKTRCDLGSDGSQGPPCRRCSQVKIECVLVTSRRGGARTRESTANVTRRPSRPTTFVESPGPTAVNSLGPFQPVDQVSWSSSRTQRETSPAADWQKAWPGPSAGSPAPAMEQRPSRIPNSIDNHINTTDLLNPSDALDLLAEVADRSAEGMNDVSQVSNPNMLHLAKTAVKPAFVAYPPIVDGFLTRANASHLLNLYHERYHAYFPVACKDVFNGADVLLHLEHEPHLLTAILIVVTKDESTWSAVHEACSRHMELLISKLMFSGSMSVGAVEALLILAEWAPQRSQETSIIGRGEEDYGAWMQVGCAIRLGYLQRLEQTGLLQEIENRDEQLGRKRVAWAACYMSDRQISIRLGKAFWSRGPGPAQLLRATDFPSLQTSGTEADDLSQIFQAHLELTQLFSNAHDILYSSSSHREHLTISLQCYEDGISPHVKATLNLSYDFLRLYINAFAFQATLNRAVDRARQSSSSSAVRGALFPNVAGSPDARFIYESIDAASSLLETLNSYIDPVSGLRFMPLKYYLYVIYAAVFLYKARISGALTIEACAGVLRSIKVTIDRLQRSATCLNSLGRRYARLLYLLWRKPPEQNERHTENNRGSQIEAASSTEHSNPEQNFGKTSDISGPDLDPLAGFSWRDLEAVGQFLTNDTSNPDGLMFHSPGFESEQMGIPGEAEGTVDWYDALCSGNNFTF
ncbi:hypothetical protein FKW77_005947 [Venturia effusa]|uniref:Zn(2)-C6 fungal-type domain-containing protein n=1 Tax=Venturia effusa TaxID=50376 RepID=A0A517LMX6_9PEZI|nr:hypothetical protein FKW77_005947 [Venturia effusa]